MKKLFSIFAITALLCLCVAAFADGPPPPPDNPGSGGGGSPGPVGAPIDGGLSILLAMGAAYGGKKLYKARQEKNKAAEPAVEN